MLTIDAHRQGCVRRCISVIAVVVVEGCRTNEGF